MACYGGHHEVVKVLLKGAPPAVILRGDEQGMTAFHHATWSGSGKCTKTLIGHATWRQGLVQVDKWGRTPLITATAKVVGYSWKSCGKQNTLCQVVEFLFSVNLLSDHDFVAGLEGNQ